MMGLGQILSAVELAGARSCSKAILAGMTVRHMAMQALPFSEIGVSPLALLIDLASLD